MLHLVHNFEKPKVFSRNPAGRRLGKEPYPTKNPHGLSMHPDTVQERLERTAINPWGVTSNKVDLVGPMNLYDLRHYIREIFGPVVLTHGEHRFRTQKLVISGVRPRDNVVNLLVVEQSSILDTATTNARTERDGDLEPQTLTAAKSRNIGIVG